MNPGINELEEIVKDKGISIMEMNLHECFLRIIDPSMLFMGFDCELKWLPFLKK